MDPRVVKALEIEAANLQAGKTSGLNILALRDEFAAKAIEGACNGVGGLPDGLYSEAMATRAYQLADAMLAARNA